ncbi:hypothetical protein BDW02DRAFT_629336 [Decorospora gaudefroyi]|uniref:Uncharacterized protein n=1 Tax=Decorospora gaudefroyi TaxID=184978 RepID=A0A6A5KIW2_9PLEO|nr:hypothetical protein BDW02DRAFT_629336 [Decorospora gaudefroyi]
MVSLMSTESLLNLFPMFDHRAFEETRKRNTSRSSESLKRRSTTLTQDENTMPPTTAGTQPTGFDLSPPVHFIDEFGCQQRRKGTFLNHTPRDFEMRSSKAVELYQPSIASTENYSRPRTSYRANSLNNSHSSTSPHAYSSSWDSRITETQTIITHGTPVELDSQEVVSPSSPEVYQPPAKPKRRSSSVPVARGLTDQPSSDTLVGQTSREVSVRSANSVTSRPQDKKRQRRQTPFKVTTPSLTKAPRHAPLEPLVAKHRRKASHDTISEMLPHIETDQAGEIGTFGVIQRYFDSQTGGPVSAPVTLCHACSPTPSCIPLPVSPEPVLLEATKEPITSCPITELHLPEEPPPAVPDRSPKRLTNPSFPIHIKSTLSIDNEFSFTCEAQHSPYHDDESLNDVLHVPEKQTTKRLDVGQADAAGSSNLGRLAPPILSHDALTASADLGLNDLSYYLKHTGPTTELQPTVKQHRKRMKLFKVKQRKSLAARVGSVEGSPQRARKQAPIPTCAREMTTSGGAKHLRIVIPTESPRNTQSDSVPKTPQRSRHVAISFTKEMLNPLGSPDVERLLSNLEAPRRSFSEPVPVSPRSPRRRPPKSPRAVPVEDHPLAIPEERRSREDQTRARKLRDLQRIKRKPLPAYYEPKDQHANAVTGALPTPAHSPEPLNDSALELDGGHDEKMEQESSISKMAQMQERIVMLQRQNTELTEALAKIVGLELENGDLRAEDVLKAFRQVRFSRE